jgi:nitrite reductase (NADH) large subunit
MGRHQRFVIVGNGGAGISAAKAIRSRDMDSPIKVISSEACFAYSPVALTHYIAGELTRDRLFITDGSFYRKYNIDLESGKRVCEIRPDDASILLADKTRIPYDRLLIATGASAFLPAELQGERVLTLRTLGDADRIISAARAHKKTVIIGGGLISLQVAYALWKRGLHVTVVVGSNQLLSRNVDSTSAGMVQRAMEEKGIVVHCGAEVVGVEKHKEGNEVHLKDGEPLFADLVLCGKGVKPNLLEGPLSTAEHMSVDGSMKTTLDNVFAAGDVSLGKHTVSKQWERVANWPNACYQGRVAGLSMAGVRSSLEGIINHNVTDLFGIELATAGLFDPPMQGDFEVLRSSDPVRRVYRKIVLQHGRVVGAILVNEICDIGPIRNLIDRKVKLTSLSGCKPGDEYNVANMLRRRPTNTTRG